MTLKLDMKNKQAVIDIKNMRSSAQEASQLLKSMSHPDRLMLLCQLTQGEYCVSDLEEKVGLSQPSLSQQLGVLRKEGIVKSRRDSKRIYYSINNKNALDILVLLYEKYCN